VNKPWYS